MTKSITRTRITDRTHACARDAFNFAHLEYIAGRRVKLGRMPNGAWTTSTITTIELVA